MGKRWGTLAVSALVGAGAVAQQARRRRANHRHRNETVFGYHAARHKILILGAGFGGMAAARRLADFLPADADASILVVARDSGLLFTPLLWTVADGRANPTEVVVPIRAFQRRQPFHFLHAEVQTIDLWRREVQTTAGPRSYDYLVIALGSVTAAPSLPGLRERALPFHSPADAIEMRNHLIDALEHAHHAVDADERREWLTFVVGGGGDTGIELAATIREYFDAGLLAAYPWLADEQPRVIVVGRADRLVPMSSPATSAMVEQALTKTGIVVWTGVSIEAVTERAVQTSRGAIPARTLFWAAGTTASPVVCALPVTHAANGAVHVDATLRPPDWPAVFVIGDSAWAFDDAGTPLPPTAQAAEHMGRYAAEAIAALIAGRNPVPFRFTTRGRLALLGDGTGVAEIAGHAFDGRAAWLLWHGYYLSKIPSWRNRLRLLVAWSLAGATGRETTQLRLGPHAPIRPVAVPTVPEAVTSTA